MGDHEAPWGQLEDQKRKVGALLKDLRERANLSTRQLAERTAMSQAKVWRIESGRLLPTSDDLPLLFDSLRASSEARQVVLSCLQATSQPCDALFDFLALNRLEPQQESYRRLTQSSDHIRNLSGATIPGYLQIADYSMALLQQRRRDGAAKDDLPGRLERQRALLDKSKRFEFVLYEPALRYRYLRLSSLRVQYHHVVSMSTLPNVSVGIVPLTSQLEDWPRFSYAIFDDDYLVLEDSFGIAATSSRYLLDEHIAIFDSAGSRALWADDARAFLRLLDDELAREIEGNEEVIDLTQKPGVESTDSAK